MSEGRRGEPIVEEPEASTILRPPPRDDVPQIRPRSAVRRPSALSTSVNVGGGAASSAAGASSSGRHHVDFARLRFDDQPSTGTVGMPSTPSILQRQGVLRPRVVEEAPFADEIDGSYSTPEWDTTASERTQLLAPGGSTYYDGAAGTGVGGGSSTTRGNAADVLGNAEGYDDGAFDDDDPLYIKSVYMLSCSILLIVSVVFVIVVSGLTKLVSRRGEPRFYVKSGWPSNGFIPEEYGCDAPDGKPQSIPLTWFNVPKEATNIVLLFFNTDSNKVHWLVTDIPLTNGEGVVVQQLPANASANASLMPSAAHQQANRYLENGHYYPPCAPLNRSHSYMLYVYAIDAKARIKHYKYANEIINGFVGVPTARLQGKYGGTNRYVGGDEHHAHANDKNEHHADEHHADEHHSNEHHADEHNEPHYYGHSVEQVDSEGRIHGTSGDL